MIHVRLKNRQVLPWWAVMLAPLVGVPAMILLLALTVSKDAPPSGDFEAGSSQDQVELRPVDYRVDRGAVEPEGTLQSC